jgi:hypothetical protein
LGIILSITMDTEHLSHNFTVLNLIVFLLHAILEFVHQEGYSFLRKATPTLRVCFERIRGVFSLIGCVKWEQFYKFALDGIDSS